MSVLFYFSSRRLHTICAIGDWSSDVCSSDLSFFEAEGHHHYNSLAIIDDQGAVMGVYRKNHIPDGPGYSEKFYFRPGNTGFKIWKTRYGTRSEERRVGKA